MVEDQRRFAFFSAADQKAVHVALAETGKRHVRLGGPAGKAAKLNPVILLSFFRTGSLEVKKELVECFFPGKRGDS